MAAIQRVKYADYTLTPEQLSVLAEEFCGKEVQLTIVEDHQTAFEFSALVLEMQVTDPVVLRYLVAHEPLSATACRDEFKHALDTTFKRAS